MAKPLELPPLRVAAPLPEGPAARITRRAADRLRQGHLWVYRTDIEQLHPAPDAASIEPGSLITVLDGRDAPLGSALFSSASQITLRLVSPSPGLTRPNYLAQLGQRIEAALDLREQLDPTDERNNAHRLLFSEADNLPGIVADRYNDLILLQLLTQGSAQPDVRELVTRVLQARLQPASILERPDPRIREIEVLEPAPAEPAFSTTPEPKTKTIFTINGLRFHYDASAGQKTGAFLDQRLNYAAAAAHAHGRALDVCTYQGGFALHLAQVCTRVTGVDASRAALEVADANLALNPQLAAQQTTDWIEADAFDLLRAYESQAGSQPSAGSGRKTDRFDTIVLDPPAFAKSKRAMEGALRGYKELNLRALKLLNPGGILITCSCSHHVSLEEFTAVLASAAADSHRRVQLLETRGAAPDHPAILTLPETTYLKCLIARID
jgi:23S rRNA (cytosine1962-C5)-methyltransferase